jgi:hypothetical protein
MLLPRRCSFIVIPNAGRDLRLRIERSVVLELLEKWFRLRMPVFLELSKSGAATKQDSPITEAQID